MLSIEEYIAKRKKEDKLNEFDVANRLENAQICTGYIFEYFNNYLDITEVEHHTVLNNERLQKFQKQLSDYSEDVQSWLINIYDEHENYMHRIIGNILDQEDVFLLFHSESEFRAISYQCYSKLIKKYPYIKDQTEMLFMFIKDYHKVKAAYAMRFDEVPWFSDKINNWIEKTQSKYNVNLPGFANDYVEKFSGAEAMWPMSHKTRTDNEYYPYEYNYKQKKNVFNIDSIYTKVSKKPFMRGHKQDLELLFMYFWLHSIDTDDEYWDEYVAKVLG